MLGDFKITAVNQVINDDKKSSFAISVNFEGTELPLWRTEKQLQADLKRSGFSTEIRKDTFSKFIGGTVTGEIIEVKAGDSYTVPVLDEKTGKEQEEKRQYKKDGLQVVMPSFLSLQKSMNSNIADSIASKYAESLGL
jgi:hypothetical protein